MLRGLSTDGEQYRGERAGHRAGARIPWRAPEHLFRYSHEPVVARYNGLQFQIRTGDKILADDKLYKAEYVGSGTFIISKPKRKKPKLRQSRLKKPQRGARK